LSYLIGQQKEDGDEELKERIRKELEELKRRLEEKKIGKKDIERLGRLYRWAIDNSDKELEKELDGLIPRIWKYIPTKEVEVKEGEIKELFDDVLVTRKDGRVQLIFL